MTPTIRVGIQTDEIPPGTDPILDLLPLFQQAGYRVVANGITENERFLWFEKEGPEEKCWPRIEVGELV